MSLPGLLLLAGLMPVLGWLVARAARVRWLQRVHPDVLPLQAVLGTAVLTCTCALLSHAGLGQRAALPLLGLLAAGLLAWNLLPGLRRQHVPRARWTAWLPLAAALASAAIVGLLPLLWKRAINPFFNSTLAGTKWIAKNSTRPITITSTFAPSPRKFVPRRRIVATLRPSR